jgi:hypothetical protein
MKQSLPSVCDKQSTFDAPIADLMGTPRRATAHCPEL